jgi:uncharacterized protein YggT (Ycf19 family)
VTRVLTWLVYAFAIVAIAFLLMAFFLELFNANESTPFVEWVDKATRRLMQPFRGIFPEVEGESGSVFDPSLLFAILMYGLLAIAMHALLDWIDRKMAAARYRAAFEPAPRPAPAPAASAQPPQVTSQPVAPPAPGTPDSP